MRTPARWRRSAPPMCIRHELSADVHTSAPRVEHAAQLVGEHRHRGVGVLDRERAAEAAALLGLGQLDEVDPAHGPQQPPRPVADVQQPQRVAGRVQRDPVRERGADVDHAELVDQELGQLEQPAGDARRGARARSPTHDADGETTASASPNTRPKRSSSGSRLRRRSRVLPCICPQQVCSSGELDLVPEALQQLDHRPARGREQRVVEARDEQGDPHRTPESKRRRRWVRAG